MTEACRPAVIWAEGPPECDPLDLFDASADEGFYWECPEREEALAARGAAWVLESRGDDRFQRLGRQVAALADGLDASGPAAPHGGAILVGGLAFAPGPSSEERWRAFGEARFVVPQALVLRRRGRTLLAAASAAGPAAARKELACLRRELAVRRPGAPADASADPESFRISSERPLADYRGRVAQALAAIHAGEVEKIVLARAVHVASRRGIEPEHLLRALRRAHPACTTFAVRRGEGVFLGATPERLVRVEGDEVRADAVAGSAPRGRSPESDARLRLRLRESKKEQEEHAFVARAVRAALASECCDVRGPEAPRVLATEGIQHLHTPFCARRNGSGLLALAGRLHPTPAVAGAPVAAARRWLGRFEGLDRGWYAGLVGWLGLSGEGELSVALRSALVEPGRATLFAGAGIVRGSAPEAELAETRLKLGGLLGPLLEI